MVAQACNPSYLGGWGGRIAWAWKLEVAEIMPLHSSLSDRTELHLKKRERDARNAGNKEVLIDLSY